MPLFKLNPNTTGQCHLVIVTRIQAIFAAGMREHDAPCVGTPTTKFVFHPDSSESTKIELEREEQGAPLRQHPHPPDGAHWHILAVKPLCVRVCGQPLDPKKIIERKPLTCAKVRVARRDRQSPLLPALGQPQHAPLPSRSLRVGRRQPLHAFLPNPTPIPQVQPRIPTTRSRGMCLPTDSPLSSSSSKCTTRTLVFAAVKKLVLYKALEPIPATGSVRQLLTPYYWLRFGDPLCGCR